MAHLSLSLLGPFQVTLDGQPVTAFKSNKVRALLAYLAVEADQPHRREMLAGLLWPEWPDRDALGNLRFTLSGLRRAIGDRTADPPFLLIAKETLQWNRAGDYSLDVTTLMELGDAQAVRSAAVDQLERAAAFYQGAFLADFSLGDSPAFEDWQLFVRERCARQVSSVLHRLAAIYEQQRDFEKVQCFARRQIELEPWDEEAHQRLMRALALSGQRGAALAQYEVCRRRLAEEMDVEPAPETTRLYQHIRDGKLAVAPPPVPTPEFIARPPPFLEEAVPQVEPPVFVARDRELARLRTLLDLALAGQGRAVFVTGEAGSGKTTLVQEFARRAQEVHADLAVATGNCNAYSGIGDPYLPFREILELLTGDVEARCAAGAMTREHARRLWHTFPVAIQALAEAGPDLVDTFVPCSDLLERATTYAPGTAGWLTRLDEVAGRIAVGRAGARSPQQNDLFEQYTRVLQAVAKGAPLLLVLDDLQWADLGSISLLFHLGRRLAGSRILLVGAYRPEEVALGRAGVRHPLEPVLNEFQRDYGEIMVELDRAESRDFLEAFLDSEPNRLGASFREMLYRQTGGHPLFTIELLRGLQERNDLIRDPEGLWIEGPTLNWEMLPARVEAVVAERIGRLADPLQEVLRVASVEGEAFTAEVVARVRATDEREMLRLLSSELDRRHRLIRAQSIQRMDGQLLSRYRFRHILFQKYLYSSQDEVERVHLHEQVGTTLEGLYGAQDQAAAIAVQLALHFQKAGITQKAIHYLYQAGLKGLQLSAYQEARAHLTRGVELLLTLPDSSERAQQELAMQLSLGMAWMGRTPGPEWESAIVRARMLCQQTGTTTQLWRTLGDLSKIYYVRGNYQKARELGEEALGVAEQAGEPLLIAVSHWYLGFILFGLGEFLKAHAHLEQMISFYEPRQHHHPLVLLGGSDAGTGALAYDACCLWCLGYPVQALRCSQEALALAREFGHAFSLTDVLCFGGCLFNAMFGDAQALHEDAVELSRLSKGLDFSSFGDTGTCYCGEALAKLGQVEEGIAQMRQGLTFRQSVDVWCHMSQIFGALAEAQAVAGQPEAGLATLASTLDLVNQTGERYYEAELYRLRGELLRIQGDEAGAEASLQKALEVARVQQARSWELRAAISLSRLWQSQGRKGGARQMLAEVYEWFTEGLDTPDLTKARTLLAELA